VHTVLFAIPPLHAFRYPASSVCIFCSGNTKFLKWIVLWIDIKLFGSHNDVSTERHLFPSPNADLSISHSVSTQAALFRFNEAIYKTLTNIMASRQVQTEVVRTFTGSTGIGIYPSATAVTGWVKRDCVGLGGKIILIGLKVTGRTCNWTLSFSTRNNCDVLPCFICYCNLQHTTVQHIEHLNTHSAVPSVHWVTVAVKYWTMDTVVYCSC